MSKIDTVRKKIDLLDEKILILLEKRAQCSREICLLKQKKGLSIEQKKREKIALLEREKSAIQKNLSAPFINSLFKAIFLESKRIQKRELGTLTKKAKNDKL